MALLMMRLAEIASPLLEEARGAVYSRVRSAGPRIHFTPPPDLAASSAPDKTASDFGARDRVPSAIQDAPRAPTNRGPARAGASASFGGILPPADTAAAPCASRNRQPLASTGPTGCLAAPEIPPGPHNRRCRLYHGFSTALSWAK